MKHRKLDRSCSGREPVKVSGLFFEQHRDRLCGPVLCRGQRQGNKSWHVLRLKNKALHAEGDDRLKGTRQLWLFNKANLSPAQRRRFAAIRQNGLKTARAWAIKEEFRWFWRHVYPVSAEEFFGQWYAWGVRCRLRPV